MIVIEEEVTVETILYRRTGLWLKPEKQQQGSPAVRLGPEQRGRSVGKVITVFRPLST